MVRGVVDGGKLGAFFFISKDQRCTGPEDAYQNRLVGIGHRQIMVVSHLPVALNERLIPLRGNGPIIIPPMGEQKIGPYTRYRLHLG